MKKGLELQVKNITRTTRKQAIEFFKQKTEHVIEVFKYEQMYMVEAFYNLRKVFNHQEQKLNRAYRTIQDQERQLEEIRTFMDDSLKKIFEVVSNKSEHIQNTLHAQVTKQKIKHSNKRRDKDIDPFALYQGYVGVVKPIDYQYEVQGYEEDMEVLRFKLEEARLQFD